MVWHQDRRSSSSDGVDMGIGRSERAHVFWLCGLSGAGKSTLAKRAAMFLREEALGVLELDGDRLRSGLCQGLGFDNTDRAENLRRAAEVAKLGLDSDLSVVAAFITPLAEHRRLVREVVGPNLSFVFIQAPLELCLQRDVKGLYAKARRGQLAQMTGLSASFEQPMEADLVINTAHGNVSASSAELVAFIRSLLGRK